ncbi:zinc finger protein 808-like isoform X6 [Athalia rosae]|uniref:zinc finger protein 808-like isoform X6 n=1 Tax=Athalia rosae TaxID=37344 RepID=UPI0020336BC6|nr:zinc finger protein 808-like isoform X6 [Athalia rosae]
MSSIPHDYEMEAGSSEILAACDESEMLIEAVDNIEEENSNQGEKYYVITEVHEEPVNLVDAAEGKQFEAANTTEQNQSWNELCRVCANSSDHLIPIFEGEGLEHDLSSKIHRYLPIQVSREDSLPSHLCYHCASTLLAWHELTESCIDAEQRLLKMKKDLQEKEQTVTLEDSLNEKSAAPPSADSNQITKTQMPAEGLRVKGESNEESKTNDSERLHGEENTASLLEKSKAEIEESSSEERIACVKCGRCKATFNGMADLLTHLNSDHKDSVHYCPHCKALYRGELKDFKLHEKTHAADVGEANKRTKNNLLCSVCNENFTSISKLKDHLLEHVNKTEQVDEPQPKVYTCSLCNETFDKKFAMRRHIYMHEGYIENKEESEILKKAQVIANNRCAWQCDTCKKVIMTKRGFLRHYRLHIGIRPCKCTFCGNQYRIKQDLRRHVRDVHERIKKHRCKICARPFANKGAKEDHQRIHSGERPYECEPCVCWTKRKSQQHLFSTLLTNLLARRNKLCMGKL